MSDFFSELRRNELKYSQQSERLALASNIQIESPQMLENVNIWNGTTCTTCTTCPSRLLAAPEWLLEVHFTCVPSWWWRCMYSEISRDPLEIDLEQLPTKVRQATRMRGCTTLSMLGGAVARFSATVNRAWVVFFCWLVCFSVCWN